MKFLKTLLASVAVAASFGAQAQVTGSLAGGPGTSFLVLSAPAGTCTGLNCTLSGSVSAIIDGGEILSSDQPFADIPAGAILDGNFLAAGPTTTQPSELTFSTGIDYISFLWGSPDLYNTLTVKTTDGDVVFDVVSLGFSVTNGDQSFSQYVQFVADVDVDITGLIFSNAPPTNAFEVANFSVTAPVPEPETYALMLAGLGAVGFISRRRRRAA